MSKGKDKKFEVKACIRTELRNHTGDRIITSFKISLTNVLRSVMEKLHNMQEDMGTVSRENCKE